MAVASGLWNFDSADLLATQGGERDIVVGGNYEISFIQGKADELTGFNFDQTWPEETENFIILVLSGALFELKEGHHYFVVEALESDEAFLKVLMTDGKLSILIHHGYLENRMNTGPIIAGEGERKDEVAVHLVTPKHRGEVGKPFIQLNDCISQELRTEEMPRSKS